jgi:two-component system chemotaxis family response regulator WspR
LAARYGGEEFAVVLPHTDAAGAEKLATRIRDEIAALGLAHAKSALQHVTVSIGVAALCPRKDQNERTLIALADKGLYQAKGQGRNRVFVVAVPAAAAAPGAGSNASSMGLGGGGLSALPV